MANNEKAQIEILHTLLLGLLLQHLGTKRKPVLDWIENEKQRVLTELTIHVPPAEAKRARQTAQSLDEAADEIFARLRSAAIAVTVLRK